MVPIEVNHRMPLPFGNERESTVHWSLAPSGDALVFIHGFGGKSTSSWGKLSHYLPLSPSHRGHDIFFYGYDSEFRSINANSAIFEQFLETLTVDPRSVLNGALQHELPPRSYHSITIVGHSLGAVVSRRALTSAVTRGVKWTRKCKLVMFAPAHSGIYALPMLISYLKIVPKLKSVLKFGVWGLFLPALQDLQPGSVFLSQLKSDVVKLVDTQEKRELRPSAILHATNDVVVIQTDFPCDPVAWWVSDRTHTNICSYDQPYLYPIEILL